MSRIVCTGAFPPNSKNLWITRSLLDACNYSCHYCPIKKNEFASKETIFHVIDFLSNIKDRDIEITLFGGEPTLHPQFEFIVEKLSQFCTVTIFTNLSAKSELYNKIGCLLSVSYHPDMISAERFIDKLSKIDKSLIGFINVMDVNEYDSEVSKVCKYCRDEEIIHRLAPVCSIGEKSKLLKSVLYSKRPDVKGYNDTLIVTEDSKKLYTDQECKFSGLTNWNGYICYKGYSAFFIDHHGNIFKCLMDQQTGNSLSIDSDMSEIFRIEESCPYDSCICENYLPKEISYGLCNEHLRDILYE